MTRVHPESDSDSDSDLEISDSSDAEFADPTTEVHGKRQYCAYWYCGGCCFDHHDHHLVKYVSAPAALLTFDIFFFLTFAVGWIITGAHTGGPPSALLTGVPCVCVSHI